VDIQVPRDRQGTFEPQLVKKGQTRLEGFDDNILALDARGMTTRDLQAQLQELYGVEVSATLISNGTEAVMEEVRKFQTRPLEPIYPIVYVDCLVVNVRENQRVRNYALYLVLAVKLDGQKELLGMWMAPSVKEPAFWLSVLDLPAESRRERYLHCLRRVRRSLHKPGCNGAWCIWSETRCGTSLIST
jgi:transposase-like protein